MFSRIHLFFSNVFLLPKEEYIFEELYIDKNDQYKADITDWALDGAYVALAYDTDLKHEIEAYKYLGRKHKKNLFVPYLRKCFDLFIAEQIDATALITSAPLFIISRLKRGYNQSGLLARDIARCSNLKYVDLLRKTKWTRHQAKLDRRARLRNVANAFSLQK